MDAFNNNSRKVPKLKSASGSLSPRLNSDSTLIRYLLAGGSPTGNHRTSGEAFSPTSVSVNSSRGSTGRSGKALSPLSGIENLISPPKLVDENLWVLDDIFVESSPGSRVSRSLSSDSSGSSYNPASSHGNRGYKMELCRSWEDIGQCRSGSKCLFAHGKEELRPSFFSTKNKSETPSLKSYNSAYPSYGPISPFLSPVNIEAPKEASPTGNFFRPKSTSQSNSPSVNSYKNTSPLCLSRSPTLIKPTSSKKGPISNKTNISRDWLPSDDGIEVRLPGSADINPPSNEHVDSYIRTVLYGPSNRRRFPVFTEICPDD